MFFFFLRIRRPPRSTLDRSSAASDVYKRQGQHVDGQVLVLHDMLGINQDFNPRFLRRYADLHTTITQAVEGYVKDVRAKEFPSADEQY